MKRELNASADGLAKGAAYGEYNRKNNMSLREYIPKEDVEKKTEEVNMIDVFEESEDEHCWMKEITNFFARVNPPRK